MFGNALGGSIREDMKAKAALPVAMSGKTKGGAYYNLNIDGPLLDPGIDMTPMKLSDWAYDDAPAAEASRWASYDPVDDLPPEQQFAAVMADRQQAATPMTSYGKAQPGYYAGLDGANTLSDVPRLDMAGQASLSAYGNSPVTTIEITYPTNEEKPSLLESAWAEIKSFAQDEWNTVSEWLDGAGPVGYEPRYQFANQTVDFALSPLTRAVSQVYNTGAIAINLTANAPALAVGLVTRNDLQRANEIILQGTQALGPMGAPFAPLAMAASGARGAAAVVRTEAQWAGVTNRQLSSVQRIEANDINLRYASTAAKAEGWESPFVQDSKIRRVTTAESAEIPFKRVHVDGVVAQTPAVCRLARL